MAVQLVRFLLTGQNDLLGIDHDDVITCVEKRRVCRLGLARQDVRDLSGKAAEDLTVRVDDVPARLDIALLWKIRTHDSPELDY
jgi:hypothetical protein